MPDTTESFHWWMLLIVPALGGLLSGFLVYTFAPEAEGHGTDAAIAAYHFKGGAIRPRVPLVKIVASAITLGTGGSGGREGPIAQIGAGFGSCLGGLLRLRPAERRLLMAAGMGAGIAAIFRAPLAGALFAAEVLVSLARFRVGGHHPRRPGQHHRLLHVRPGLRTGPASAGIPSSNCRPASPAP